MAHKMGKSTSASSSSISILPPEVITDVLIRLSVKDLGRSKCVSPSWRSLISDRDFVKNHYRRSAADARSEHHRVLVAADEERYLSIPLRTIIDENEEEIKACVDLGLDWGYCNDMSLVASSKGLVCLRTRRKGKLELIVLNPVTKWSRALPQSSTMKPSRGFGFLDSLFGFGFDSVDDDYKMVSVRFDLVGNPLEVAGSHVELFSMRNNVWKRIGEFPKGWMYCDNVCISGAALVWKGLTKGGDDRKWKLAALDLSSERYVELTLPDGVEDPERHVTIGEVDGCLSAYAYSPGRYVDVWIMKEFRVKESWTKITRVPFLSDGHLIISAAYQPVWFPKDGEVFIIWQESSLIIYNVKTGTLRFLVTRQPCLLCQPVAYIESLVSPEVNGN